VKVQAKNILVYLHYKIKGILLNNTILKKALFLDRDGIINIDHGYTYKIEDFEFVEDIFNFIKAYSDAGYIIFIVTNQSGIGRGYYTKQDFKHLTTWMLNIFKSKQIHIENVYFCPHSPEENCHCRKPNIGMMEQALSAYDIDLTNSWLVGDKQSDIDFAIHANIGNRIAIGGEDTFTGYTHRFTSISEALSHLPTL